MDWQFLPWLSIIVNSPSDFDDNAEDNNLWLGRIIGIKFNKGEDPILKIQWYQAGADVAKWDASLYVLLMLCVCGNWPVLTEILAAVNPSGARLEND